MDSQAQEFKEAIINRAQLPEQFPTNRHTPQFWEYLGRAVATFGFLEDNLKRAIFAFTAITTYSGDDAKVALEKWFLELERTLSDTLKPLAKKYGDAVRNYHQDSVTLDVDELIEKIRIASEVRNVLCHGMWNPPDGRGMSLPRFFNRNSERFDTPVDIEFLAKVQRHVMELSCDIIDSVTRMGLQFPGGAGPGKKIWT